MKIYGNTFKSTDKRISYISLHGFITTSARIEFEMRVHKLIDEEESKDFRECYPNLTHMCESLSYVVPLEPLGVPMVHLTKTCKGDYTFVDDYKNYLQDKLKNLGVEDYELKDFYQCIMYQALICETKALTLGVAILEKLKEDEEFARNILPLINKL